jgi:hypothetical protein
MTKPRGLALEPCSFRKYYEDGCQCPPCKVFEKAQHRQVQGIIAAIKAGRRGGKR